MAARDHPLIPLGNLDIPTFARSKVSAGLKTT